MKKKVNRSKSQDLEASSTQLNTTKDTVGLDKSEAAVTKEQEAIASEDLNHVTVHPPDGGYGWVIVAVSFLCSFVLDGIMGSFGILLPQMSIDFNAGKGEVAWAGSLFVGFSLCIGPLVSACTNKFGCRPVCICGGIIGSIGFIISSFSNTLALLLVSYGVIGAIGYGLLFLPNIVSVGYYFEKRRALATGISFCGSGFGSIFLPPMASWLMGFTTWRYVNLVFAGMLFLCGISGILIKPLDLKLEGIDDQQKEKASDSDPTKHPSRDKFDVVNEVTEKRKSMVQWQEETAKPKLDRKRKSRLSRSHSMGSLKDGNVESAKHSRDATAPSAPPKTGIEADAARPKRRRSSKSSKKIKMNIEDDETDPVSENLDNMEKSSQKNRKRRRMSSKGGLAPKMSDTFLLDSFVQPLSKEAAKVKRRRTLEESGELQQFGTQAASDYSRRSSSRTRRKSKTKLSGTVDKAEVEGSEHLLGSEQTQVTFDTGQKDQVKEPIVRPKAGTIGSVLRNFMDCSLLKSPVFLLIAMSNVIGMMGFFVPYVFIIDYCSEKGIPADQAAMLISVIGFVNTVGSVGCGVISDCPFISSLHLNNACLLGMGICVMSVPICNNFISLIINYTIFGLFGAGSTSLTSIMLIDLLGTGNLSNAFGLLILFRGCAAMVGSPLAGFLYDIFKSYEIPFFLAGLFLVLASFVSSIIPCVIRCKKRKKLRQESPNTNRLNQVHPTEDVPESLEPSIQLGTTVSTANDPNASQKLPR